MVSYETHAIAVDTVTLWAISVPLFVWYVTSAAFAALRLHERSFDVSVGGVWACAKRTRKLLQENSSTANPKSEETFNGQKVQAGDVAVAGASPQRAGASRVGQWQDAERRMWKWWRGVLVFMYRRGAVNAVVATGWALLFTVLAPFYWKRTHQDKRRLAFYIGEMYVFSLHVYVNLCGCSDVREPASLPTAIASPSPSCSSLVTHRLTPNNTNAGPCSTSRSSASQCGA